MTFYTRLSDVDYHKKLREVLELIHTEVSILENKSTREAAEKNIKTQKGKWNEKD